MALMHLSPQGGTSPGVCTGPTAGLGWDRAAQQQKGPKQNEKEFAILMQ